MLATVSLLEWIIYITIGIIVVGIMAYIIARKYYRLKHPKKEKEEDEE